MEFDNDYWHAIDKQAAQNLKVNPEYIGISAPPMQDTLDALKTKIFEGAKVVELGFVMGRGAGSRAQGGFVPEMFGQEERRAMRSLAKINEVQLTTHAPHTQGLSGLSEGGFKEEVQEETLNEIKRTVDFAADVAQGGPITVHSGELPRPIFEADKQFLMYPEEEKKAPIAFVDIRTGQLQQIKRDTEILRAVKDEKGELQYDKEGKIKFEPKTYIDIEKEAKEKGINPIKYFYDEFFRARREQYEAESKTFEIRTKETQREIEQFENMKKGIEAAENKKYATEIMLDSFKRRFPEEFVEKFKENPEEFLNNRIKERKNVLKYYMEGAISYAQAAREYERTKENIVPAQDYAVQKAAETLARAAIYSYDKEKDMNLSKPLFISPENLYPEQYGAHPEELRNLVLKGREEMVKKLIKERKISESEAKEIAKDHIKATFDVGHAHTWKKYFQGTEEEYKRWFKDQVEKLTKDGILGHVHLTDNFGYHDSHLAPGQGSVPFKEFMEAVREEGDYEGPMIVEPGAQELTKQWQAMTNAWRLFNSPIYRIDGASVAWTDIEQSYFGRTGSPTFLVGDVAPSKDWTLWSETPLE